MTPEGPPVGTDSTAEGARRPPLPEWLLLIHLVVLASFAVVQPTLSVLSDSIDFFFPARRVSGGLFVLTLALFALVPPLMLWLAGAGLGRLRPGWRWRLHLAAIWILAALLVAYTIRNRGLGVASTAAVVVLLATLLTWLYDRFQPLRSILSVLAPAPVFFVVYFLGFTDASHLVTGAETDVRAGQASRPMPVVVVVLDELPAASLMDAEGKVDRARFPNIARLAGDSTWYRTALADAWTTFEAVPAILTGLHQNGGKLPVVFDHPRNLFTLFRDDYNERVIESFTRLCPLSVCPNEASAARRVRSLLEALTLTYGTVVTPRLERKLPTPGNTLSSVIAALNPKQRVSPNSYEVADLRLFPGVQFERFLQLVRRREPSDRRPSLYFLHANLPHNPWNHLPDGRLYRDHSKRENGLDPNTEQWERNAGAVIAGWQRHLLQTQFADRLVGELTRRLREAGIYRQAAVVLVADHGVSFRPGSNRRKPRADNLADISLVPLFVKLPGERGGRVDNRPVGTIDVLPTLAKAAGMRLPWRVDGEPLDTATPRRRPLSLLTESGARIPHKAGSLRRQRRNTLDLKTQLFGSGAGGPGYYGIGPARPLQRKPLSGTSMGKPLPGTVELEEAGDFGEVDLKGPFLPALVRGRIAGARRGVNSVAVAVNNRVAGSGFLYNDSFEVMVDPHLFREGSNSVRVLGVTMGSAGVRLHPLGGG